MATPSPSLPNLNPGDVLLYQPSSFFGSLIKIKTWHNVAHVEMFIGSGHSIASRDGQGVNAYPLREGYAYVMRPNVPFNMGHALVYFKSMIGTPYGWLDLLNFMGITINKKGIVCSPFITEVLRAGGVPIFNNEASTLIAPFQFLDSELLTQIFPKVSP